jgi:hypothetical protein
VPNASQTIDDRIIPEERPTEADKRRIRVIHSRLGALRNDLRNCRPAQVTRGVRINQFDSAIQELSMLTGGRDYSSFMPDLLQTDDGSLECLSIELRSAVVMLIEELREDFIPDQVPYYSPVQPPSPMTINTSALAQADAQNITETEITFITNLKQDLEPKINEELANYTEGTNEHTFLTRFKTGLDRIRSFAGLMTLAYSTAQAVGLSEHEIQLLLRSLGLNL